MEEKVEKASNHQENPHSAVCVINFCKVACSADYQCKAFEYLYNIRRPAT